MTSRTHIADTTRPPVVWERGGTRAPWVRMRTRCGRLYGIDAIADRLDDATCAHCQRWLAREREAMAVAADEAWALGISGREVAEGWR